MADDPSKADQASTRVPAATIPTETGSSLAQVPTPKAEARAKALDFLIDKTYAAQIECVKAVGLALTSYLVLMLLGIILIFGSAVGVPQSVAIPFLQLTVDKYFAAVVIIAFSSGSLCWFYSSITMAVLLDMKLHSLLETRYPEQVGGNWHIQYPSVFVTSYIILSSIRYGIVAIWGLFGSMILASLVAPPVLAWYLSEAARYGTTVQTTLCILAVLSVVPSLILLFIGFFAVDWSRLERLYLWKGAFFE